MYTVQLKLKSDYPGLHTIPLCAEHHRALAPLLACALCRRRLTKHHNLHFIHHVSARELDCWPLVILIVLFFFRENCKDRGNLVFKTLSCLVLSSCFLRPHSLIVGFQICFYTLSRSFLTVGFYGLCSSLCLPLSCAR